MLDGITVNKSSLQRIEIPKIIFTVRITVKTAIFDQTAVYLLNSNQVNECKILFQNLDFISFNRRLSAFLIPQEEQKIYELLKALKGKAYLAIHTHVKFNSLYLQALLWRLYELET